MAAKNKLCQICETPFIAKRSDAKTCSSTCRKQLHRLSLQQATRKVARLESALGQRFHQLAAELLSQHAKLELTDERGAIAAPNLAVPGLSQDQAEDVAVRVVSSEPAMVQPEPTIVQPEPPSGSQPSDLVDNSLETPAAPTTELPMQEFEVPMVAHGATRFSLFRFNARAMMVTAGLLLVVGAATLTGVLLTGQKSKPNGQPGQSYAVKNLPLQGLKSDAQLGLDQASRLEVNGQLRANDGFVLAPANAAPNDPTMGQFYISSATRKVYYYDGSQFLSLATDSSLAALSAQTASLQAASTGSGLTITAVGTGLALNGTTLVSTGVTSISGTNGQIIASSPTGDVTLSLPEFAVGSLLYGNGAGQPIGSLAPGNIAGECLLSNGPGVAPSYQNCPGIQGNGSVFHGTSTVNRIAKFTASDTVSDSSISDDGTTVSVGANLAVTGTHTFTVGTGTTLLNGALTVNGITGLNSSVQITGNTTLAQQLTVAGLATFNGGIGLGNNSSFTQTGSGSFSTGTGAVTLNGNTTIAGAGSFTTGSGGVALNGNVTLAAGKNFVQNGVGSFTTGSGAVNLNGATTVATTLSVLGGTASLGSNSVQGSLLLQAGNGQVATLRAIGTLAQNTVYTLPDPGAAGATICLTTGNCAGTGGGITGSGTAGNLAKFNASGSITNSGLSESGSTLTYAGNLTGLTGLTSAGTITFGGLNAVGVVHTDGSGVLSTSAVALGTDTSGNYVASLGTLTGLSTAGNGGAGSTPSLSVLYGATANTAAQGNTVLSFSGTGNLVGSVSGTAGGGFTSNTLAITNSPVFSGTLVVQGASTTIGAAAVQGSLILNAGNTKLGTLQALATLGQNTTYTLPDPGQATATICLSTGNCTSAGVAGGDLTGSYPNPTIAKLQGTTLTLGAPSSGQIIQYNGTAYVNQTVTGDITLDGAGVSTIGNGKVTNAKLQNSSLTVTAGNGLLGGGSVSLGSSTSLSVAYGSTLNTAVQGNTQLTVTAGTGLSGGGTITLGAGGTTSLDVVYGSTAGTAVQGNITLVCPAGTGNLTGGGNSVTLGAGGSCNSLTVVNSPTFSGTLAVQGATVTVGAAAQQGSVVFNAGNTFKGTLQTISTLGQNTTYTLPDPGVASADICLSTGNCAGTGSGITGTGITGHLAKFNSSGSVTSSTLSESGSTVTASGNFVIQGSGSLTLGTANTNDGSVAFLNSAGTHSVTLQAPATDPASDLTFFLPAADGGNGDCLLTDGAGNLSFQACTGGAGGGVTSVNGLSGVISIANATTGGSTITINDAKADGATKGIAAFNATNFSDNGAGVINTIQDIATGSAPTFSALTLQNNTTSLSLSGTPAASATSSLVQIGGAIAGGNAAANGGTYLGLNEPVSGAGSTADFLNFQVNGTSKLRVSNSGAITAAGQLTVTSGGLAVTGSSTISGTLSGLTGLTSSGTITFSSLNSAGVVHSNNSGVLSTGPVLLGSETTGSYVANLGSLTGLTTSGNSGAGSTPTLSVNYGSSANTAVQGNTTLVCPSGTGNLAGTGNTITLGTGGTCNSLTVVNNPTFSGLVTANGGLTVGTGSNFTNNGSTLYTAIALGDFPTGGPIGTAPATVDVGTSFSINQTTAGQTLSLPNPTNTAAARLILINNIGTVSFDMHGATIQAGTGALLLWNGTAWTITNNAVAGTGLTQSGNIINSAAPTSVVNDTNVQGSIASNTLTLSWAGQLSVSRGGTGTGSFTSNGILFGNGTGALQVTAAAANSVLVTNGSNVPSLSQTLPTAVQGNITQTGALAAGSITGGFGTISTNNTISTTSALQGGSLSVGSGAFTVNGGGAVTGGTYNGQTISSAASFTGTVDVAGQLNANGGIVTNNTNINAGTGTITSGLINGQTISSAANFTGSLAVATSETVGTTLAVTGATTTTGGLVNPGSTLDTALALSDFPTGGPIGTAAATVDTHTSITINQTTAGQTLTIPSPTVTTAGRILYISNVGTASFTIGSVVFSSGSTAQYVWNGTAWSFGSIDTGVTIVGAIDSQTKSANGAVIVGNTIYLQNADATNVGLVSTGTQTLAGAKTFSGAVAVQGAGSFTAAGTGLAVTNNATIGGTLGVTGITTLTGQLNANGGIVTNNTNINAGTGTITSGLINGQTISSAANFTGSLAVATSETVGTTLAVTGLGTFSGGLTVATGSTFTNASSTLNTAIAISDHPTGGNIGTAAATVDVATTFNVTQTTAGQALTLPSPTVATAGRIVYVNSLAGNASFTMYGVTVTASNSAAYTWNGTVWTALAIGNNIGGGSGVNTVGTIDSQTKSANGAVIVGNTIYLQNADATNVGLVSTGTQTFAGAKTFSAAGTALAVTNNATVGGSLTVGTAGSVVGNLNLANATSSRTVQLQGLNPSGTGNATIQIPSIAGGSTDTVCLVSLGNCAGTGSGVTASPSGTVGTIAKFSVTGQNIGDSTLTESGSAVTASGTLVVQGASALTLGTGTGNTGAILFKNSTNNNTLTLQSGASGSNFSLTLPTTGGNNGDCLLSGGSGVLSFGACTGGAGGGVTSLDSQTGVLTLANSSGATGTITIDNAAADGTTKGIATFNSTNFSASAGVVNTIQNINTTATPQFANLGLNTVANANNRLLVNGVTTADSLAQALVGTGATTNKGLVIQGVASQSADLLQLQNSAGTILTAFNASGQLVFGPSGSQDTNLYRSAANSLKTDSNLIANGPQFTNNGSTLNTASSLGDFPAGGAIGTAAATVDTHTSFAIAQTTAGQTLSLPSPTTTTAGRVVFVFNTGTTSFTMHSVSILNGYGQTYIWNGTSWILGASGGGSAITLQSAYDGGNALTTSNARDIGIALADTSIDSNFKININTGSTGQFQIQNNGSNVLAIGSAGQLQLAVQGSTGGILLGGDANLYRSAASTLKTDSSFAVGSNFSVTASTGTTVLQGGASQLGIINQSASTNTVIYSQVSGDTNNRFAIQADGTLKWGTGAGAADTNLYRSATGVLRTDGSLAFGAAGTAMLSAYDNNTIGITSGKGLNLQGSGVLTVGVGNATSGITTINPGSINIGASSLGTNNKLIVNTATTADNLATAIIDTSATTNKGLVIQGVASQAADLFQLQDSAGNINASFSSSGAGLTLGRIAASGTVTAGSLTFGDGTTDNFSVTLQSATLGASQTVNLPNGSGTICLQNSVSCGFAATSGGSAYIQNQSASAQSANFFIQSAALGTVGGIIRGASSQTADLLQFQNSGGTILSEVTSAGALQGGNATGSNVAGSDLALNGGQGTGTGVGGNISFTIFKAGSSGSSNNTTPSTVFSLSGTNGSALFQNATDSTTAFRIQNTGSTNLFVADTTNQRIGIGITTPTSILHVTQAQPVAVGTTIGTAATQVLNVTGGTGGDTSIVTNGTGGAGGLIGLTGGTGGQATAAATTAIGGAGGALLFNGGVGGASSIGGTAGNAGGAGGAFNWVAGTGGLANGATSATNTGGIGGQVTLQAGTGGAATLGSGNLVGGAGGQLVLSGGTGGVGSTSGGNGGAVTLQGGSAAAMDGAAGGAVTVSGKGGSSTGTGGAGGALTLQGGAAGGDNTVNRSGGAVALTAGVSKGPTAAGGAITLTAGAGGQNLNTGTAIGPGGGGSTLTLGAGGTAPNADVLSTGGNGGVYTITGAAGGAASVAGTGNNTGGTGSVFTWTAGTGGAANGVTSGNNTGGGGGAITLQAGTGGAATLGSGNLVGGGGGALTLSGGTGGLGTTSGGNGGGATLQGGTAAAMDGAAGGSATISGRAGSTTGTGGAGGNVTIQGGAAGGDNTTNRAGGTITLTAGAAKGPTQAAGAITLTAGAGGQNLNTGTATGPTGGAFTFTLGAGGTAPNADVLSSGGSAGTYTITGGLGGTASVAGTGNNTGGTGSTFTWTAGTGGAASGVTSGTNTGGQGGAVTLQAGTGGAASLGSGNAVGGTGGALTLSGGTGGTSATTGAGTVTGGNGGAVTLQGGAAAALAGAAGGAVTVSGRAGSTTGTGGAGGALTLQGGAAGGDNTVNRAGGTIALTAGASKGATQAGGAITLTAGAGGINTGTGTQTGPTGGGFTFTLGAGGTATSADVASTGGAAGTYTITGGVGGVANVAGITNTGGTGSAFTWTAGTGGAATGSGAATNTGGTGGAITIKAGTGGGASLGAAATGGNGGSLTLQAGTGATGSTTNGNGGNLVLAGGITSGAGAAGGSIQLQTASTTALATVLTLANNGAATFENSANSSTAFRIQNASAQNVFVADTSAQRVAVGPAAVPANGVLTVGTNTSAATGGLYLGTDTNLYRSAVSTLKTDGSLLIEGNSGDNALIASGTLYSTGTIAQTTTAITGTSTVFSAAMVGGTITYNDGVTATITAFIDSTHLTSSLSKTVTAGATYSITYGGAIVSSTGSALFQNASNSTAAFQVQNASGTSVLNVDTTNSQLTVRGINSDATIGSENIPTAGTNDFCTNWTTTNWTSSGPCPTASTSVTHTTGNTSALTYNSFTPSIGTTYQVTYTITGSPTAAESVTVGLGGGTGVIGIHGNATNTNVITATSTAVLTFTPTSSWNGTISAVSVKAVTLSNAPLQVSDSAGAVSLEVRTSSQSLNNTFIGRLSGQSNTTGTANVGLGLSALQNNTTGTGNTAVGNLALLTNTTGVSNVAIGKQALSSNTIGSNNIALGNSALIGNTTGNFNTAVGVTALNNNSSGLQNTALGAGALFQTSTGSNNVGLGFQAGSTSVSANANTSGTNNTFLGFQAGPGSSTQLQNSTAIGSASVVSQNDSLVLGCINGVNGCTASTSVGIGTASPTAILDVRGNALFKNTADSATAFQIQNSSAAALFTANTLTGVLTQSFTNFTYKGGVDVSGSSTGTTSLAMNTTAMAVSGNYAFVGTAGSATACVSTAGSAAGCEIQVYDVSNPASPTFISGLDASGSNSPGTTGQAINTLAISGHYLFAGTANSTAACSQAAGSAAGCEFKVFDISNPAAPVYVAGLDISGSATGVNGLAINTIAISGHYAYIGSVGNTTACSQSTGLGAAACEFKVFDISNPLAPTYLAGRDVSGSATGTGGIDIKSIAIKGSYAFIATAGNGATACATGAGNAIGCELQVYDVADPTVPVYLGGADSSGAANSGSGTQSFNDLSVAGNYAYIAGAASSGTCSTTSSGCELKMFDISDPTAPTGVGGADATGSSNSGTGNLAFNSVAIAGRYVYTGAAGSATACATGAGNAIGCEFKAFDTSGIEAVSAAVGSLASGNLQVANSANISKDLTVTGGLTVGGTAAIQGNLSVNGTFTAVTSSASSVAAIVQAAASQTADIFQVQNSSGTVLSKFDASGFLRGADASGSNVAGSALTLGGGQGTGTGAGGNIVFNVYKAGSSGSSLNTTATAALTLSGTNGSATFLNSTNSTTAFQVQSTTPATIFDVDTTNGRVGIGSGNTAPGRTLDVIGNQGGNTVVDSQALTATPGAPIAESTKALAYFLSNTTGTTAGVTPTVTFNITGVPSTEGSYVYVHAEAIKGTSATASSSTVVVQINGTQISSVTSGFGTASGTAEKSYIAMYSGTGSTSGAAWRIMAYGNTTSGNTTDTSDLAEWIPYTGNQPTAGELLTVGDSAVSAKQSATPYDSKLIGVVTTSPNTVFGADDGHSVRMALTGRVPVKVSLENGPVAAGDYLTASSTPGVAMKATHSGRVIGTALEAWDGTSGSDTVMTQVQPGYANIVNEAGQLQGDQSINGSLSLTGNITAGGNLNVGGITTSYDLVVTGSATVGTLTVTGSAQFAGNITVGGHIITAGDQPVTQVQGAAGTGATVTIDGNDTAGTITIQTGSAGLSAGDLAKVIFSKTYDKAPRILITGQNGASAGNFIYPAGKSATDFMLHIDGSPQANASYVFDYFIAQ